jgi:RimJ/RimL family protein N-acetyltransferase
MNSNVPSKHTVTHYHDFKQFLEDCTPFLLAQLAKRHKLYSILARFTPESVASRDPRLYRIDEGENIVGLGIIVSRLPARLLFSCCDDLAAIDALCTAVRNDGVALTSFDAIDSHAAHFAAQWGPHQSSWQLINYRLIGTPPALQSNGNMRPARPEDVGWLADWKYRFLIEVHINPDSESVKQETAEQLALAEPILWLWEVDGVPVSMCLAHGDQYVRRIGYVYIPEHFRGKGYSRALLTTVCRQIRQGSAAEITLDAEADNAISNKLYLSLGFEVMSTSSEYRF